jgi:hypothetical protein
VADESRPYNNEDDFDTGAHNVTDLIVDNLIEVFGVTDNG